MIRRIGSHALALSAVLAVSGPVSAQHPWEDAPTVEHAVARAVADAMPETRYPWRLNWTAFGVRGGRDIFWHLAPPGYEPIRDLPEGVYRRTGWLLVNGRSGSVAVCGDAERIGGMAVSVADLWLDEADVIEQLAARGVEATLLQSLEAEPPSDDVHPRYDAMLRAHPALRRWRLEQAGRDPVLLSAAHACTPPGTRHAIHCWITWRVTFAPETPQPGADCPLPGRYGG